MCLGFFSFSSVLGNPEADSAALNGAEDKVLDHKSDEDDSRETREDRRYLEEVFVFVDEPTESARTCADTKDQFGCDQCPPGKGPAHA